MNPIRGSFLVVLGLALAACGNGEPPADPAPADPGQPEAMEMDMEGGAIRLTADQVRTFGVTFDTVAVRPLEKTIRAVGRVEFDETRMAYVAPRFGGFVERLHVDFEGKAVTRGQPLLEIYSPDLVTAQEELLLARRLGDTVGSSGVEGVAEGAGELFASARRRLEYWDISEPQIDRLLATGEVRKTLTLHAPVSGIVMTKNVFEGQAFEPGENLYMIADLSEVWVEAELFESDAPLVGEGMAAAVTLTALPGRVLEGTVEYVYPTVAEETRSLRARVALSNPDGTLKPGMYATVRLERDLGEVLAVPRPAVLNTGEKSIAFVDLGGGRLEPREVTLGIAGSGYVEVLEGLERGQRVVTSAQFLLDSESNLAEVMRAMMAQMNLSDVEGMEMGNMDMDAPPDTGATRDMDMPRGEE